MVYWIWQWVSCHWFALVSRRTSIYCSSAGRGTTSPGIHPGSWHKPRLLVERLACSAPGNKIHYLLNKSKGSTYETNPKLASNRNHLTVNMLIMVLVPTVCSCDMMTHRWFDLSRFLGNSNTFVHLLYVIWLYRVTGANLTDLRRLVLRVWGSGEINDPSFHSEMMPF